jgi:hypothetical protein
MQQADATGCSFICYDHITSAWAANFRMKLPEVDITAARGVLVVWSDAWDLGQF